MRICTAEIFNLEPLIGINRANLRVWGRLFKGLCGQPDGTEASIAPTRGETPKMKRIACIPVNTGYAVHREWRFSDLARFAYAVYGLRELG